MTTETMAWARGYEDSYEGAECDDGPQLLANLHGADSPWAALNIPIWIDVPRNAPGEDCSDCIEESEDCGSHRLTVGVMKPRHGDNIIYYTDRWTHEDAHAIRLLMLNVWAHRADVGFVR